MLFYILLALGAALTALVFVLAPSLSLWWAIPIALGMIVLLNGLYLLAVWIYCKSIDMDREYDTIDPVAHRWTMTFIRWLLAAAAIVLIILGIAGGEPSPSGDGHRRGRWSCMPGGLRSAAHARGVQWHVCEVPCVLDIPDGVWLVIWL